MVNLSLSLSLTTPLAAAARVRDCVMCVHEYSVI